MRQAAYLHIPFCRRRCFYCDFPISVIGDRARGETSNSMAEYVDWLCAEIVATPKDALPLKTVFFGGGTPSLLSVAQVEKLLNCLEQTIGLDSHPEISIEMDPGTFTPAQVQGLLAAGITRISLGAQAFQDQHLESCGRSHRIADIFQSVEILQQQNVPNFSIDLISGLPHQTLEDWNDSLTQAIQLKPHHLSCYDLVLEDTTVFGKRDQQGKLHLPADEISAQMYRLASQTLTAAGYHHYEISNYAQPKFECQHNLTYWHNHDFYGFGMGAASYHHHRRVSRPRTRQTYYDWIQRLQANDQKVFHETPQLSVSDRLFETLMVGLRLSQGVNLQAIAQSFDLPLVKPIHEAMNPYLQKGWVHFDPRSQILRLSDPDGFLYSNQILIQLWEALDHISGL